MTPIQLPRPVLFLDFFVREVSFQGKGTVRTTLPADAFFYTGESKATSYLYWQQNSHAAQQMGINRWQKKHLTSIPRLLSFIDERPVISTLTVDQGKDQLWFKPDIAVIANIGHEFLHENTWFRTPDEVVTHHYCGKEDCFRYVNLHEILPWGFFGPILDVDDAGIIWRSGTTPWPVKLIAPGETHCHLWRTTETTHKKPNRNMVMFIKNYGLHQTVRCVTPMDAGQYDSSHLCREKFTVRDGRYHQRVD
ncbi:TPA: hypothetical protein ACGQLC_003343 [Escherichia coli]|uniref:hypothetical protein n=1 Tax=unclassified Escherichia TaxID=2608889 RepID=UPI0013000545|nr:MULTISPECIES: hypothetical protein [unclassified Escherichia]EME6422507.1 hypothetical protein [Escherichia coli]MBB2271649.1 hypothetical protein [Escherichia sp. 94.0001]MCS1347027.1 hypothetical protein [Escherichia coli]HAW4050816.1 hypothetical protein [Escherichia coli]